MLFPAETQRRRDKRRERTNTSFGGAGFSLSIRAKLGGFFDATNILFPAETQRRRGKRREDREPDCYCVLCAYLCVSASLRGINIPRAGDAHRDGGGDTPRAVRCRAAVGDGGLSRDGDGRCAGGDRHVPRAAGGKRDRPSGGGARAVAARPVPGEAGAAAGGARDVFAGGARVRVRERD